MTYQWQVSNDGGSTWTNSGMTGYNTATLSNIEATKLRYGYLYRCKITDSAGNVVYSEPCEIVLAADTWEFTYSADGLRTSRTDGCITYNYVYNGGQLAQMTVGDQVLRFGYDASGAPLYVIWNASKYFYTTNLQGDVVAIVSVNGNPVVEYTYDAWGNILSVTGTRADNLGKYNPLRYRGYVYDIETELYYLQSRYYDPNLGRFINADVVFDYDVGIQGFDLFLYCGNNPVNRIDVSGTDSDGIADGEDMLDEALLKGGGGGNGKPSGSNSTGMGGNVCQGGYGSGVNNTISIPNNAPSIPQNGTTLTASEAIDTAIDFLGDGYVDMGGGRFVSSDGLRQIRMGDGDLLGTHAGGPHINFNILSPKYKNVHVYISDIR